MQRDGFSLGLVLEVEELCRAKKITKMPHGKESMVKVFTPGRSRGALRSAKIKFKTEWQTMTETNA